MQVKSGKADLFKLAQQASSSEAKITGETSTTATLAKAVSVVAPKKAPSGADASVKGEVQMSAAATKADLSNQLEKKIKSDFAQKKTNNPVLKNANSPGSARVRASFYPGDEPKKARAHKPTTLTLGSGNDKVFIHKGDDGRVHVNVNGKEAWSGTLEKFKKLTIDTGDGEDVVINTVSGARIMTGKGKDTVENWAHYSSIDTGDQDDIVNNYGWYNTIHTGGGQDTVDSHQGSYNRIDGGEDANDISSDVGGNIITGGEYRPKLR